MDYIEQYRQLLSTTLGNIIRREIGCIADHLKSSKKIFYLLDEGLYDEVKFFLEEYSAIDAKGIQNMNEIDNDDVLLCISFVEHSQEMKCYGEQFKERNAKITCITNNIDSDLAHLSHDVLGIHVPTMEGVDAKVYQAIYRQAIRVVLEDMKKRVALAV